MRKEKQCGKRKFYTACATQALLENCIWLLSSLTKTVATFGILSCKEILNCLSQGKSWPLECWREPCNLTGGAVLPDVTRWWGDATTWCPPTVCVLQRKLATPMQPDMCTRDYQSLQVSRSRYNRKHRNRTRLSRVPRKYVRAYDHESDRVLSPRCRAPKPVSEWVTYKR